MITGVEYPMPVDLQTSAGVAVNYADKTAFLAANWNLSFQDADGAALSPQPAWDISAGSGGRHVITFACPAGPFTCQIVRPAAHISNPWEFFGEGLTTSTDTLYALFLSSTGVPTTDTVNATQSVIFDGDSISINMLVSDSALTLLGAANLAACTLSAQAKRTTQDSDDAADVTTFTETIVTDTLGARLVNVSLAAFPSILSVPDDQETISARIDLRLTYSGKTLTGAVHNLTVTWKAHT